MELKEARPEEDDQGLLTAPRFDLVRKAPSPGLEAHGIQSRGPDALESGEDRSPSAGVLTVPCVHPSRQLRVLFPARDFITNHQFEIAHCPLCGFDVTSPQPNFQEIGAYYP